MHTNYAGLTTDLGFPDVEISPHFDAKVIVCYTQTCMRLEVFNVRELCMP